MKTDCFFRSRFKSPFFVIFSAAFRNFPDLYTYDLELKKEFITKWFWYKETKA